MTNLLQILTVLETEACATEEENNMQVNYEKDLERQDRNLLIVAVAAALLFGVAPWVIGWGTIIKLIIW